MNERIRELAEQATIRVNNPTVNSNGKVICDNWEEGVSLSKFAELLIEDTVRQCAEFAEYQLQIGGTNADKIKQHFGVK